MNCKFCQKEVKNNNSKAQHEIRCSSNPDKIKVKPSFGMLGKRGSNQHIKGTAKPLSEETRKRISEASKNQVWSNERRKKLSESMKRAVQKFPESYTSSNRGRTKQIIVDGIKFQGCWEVEFYNFCKHQNLDIEKCTESFPYFWDGERTYYPDFFIKDLDLYVEVKGYETEKDRAKWKCFPRKLAIIKKDDIIAIRKNSFSIAKLTPL